MISLVIQGAGPVCNSKLLGGMGRKQSFPKKFRLGVLSLGVLSEISAANCSKNTLFNP